MKQCLLLLLSLMSVQSFGQLESINFKNYSVRDGLSHTKVNSICQDKEGFIWFGTEVGLNKFDGIVFHKYYSTYDSPASLSGNNIEVILKDESGNLLIGTDKGLEVYNYESDSFERFWTLSQDTLRHTLSHITALALDMDKRLWVGTINGLILFEHIDLSESISGDPASVEFEYVYQGKINGLSDAFINCITQDRSGNIWVGTLNGLNLISRNTEQVKQFFHDPADPTTLSHNQVNNVFQCGKVNHKV